MSKSYPVFERDTSSLTTSNDGRMRIERERETTPNGFVVVDNEDRHVELFTLKSEIADAFVAGYDYRERLSRPTGEDPVEAINHLIRKANDAFDEADKASGVYGEGGQEAMEDYYACEARLDALQKARAIFVGSMLDLEPDRAAESDVTIYGAGC
jgi:hypothetical protein